MDIAGIAAAVEQQLALITPPDSGTPRTRRAPRSPRPPMDWSGMEAAVTAQLALFTKAAGNLGDAIGWVPVADAAWGIYGTAEGVDLHRQATSATGYLAYYHPLRGGPGGTGADTTAVYITDLPTIGRPAGQVVYTDPDAPFTVLNPPPGMPPGGPAPWTRMPIEDQVLAAGDLVGRPVTVTAGPHGLLYQIQGDEPTALSRAAEYLLAGGYLHSLGLTGPVPHPNRLAEAPSAAPRTTHGGTR